MTKNVLSLNSKQALNFFLKSEQYHNFELPEYFEFNEVLKYVQQIIKNKSFSSCLNDINPDDIENININILLNKDGYYAIRPIILANPYLYYFLARELCNESGWKSVKKCFKAFNVPHITSCALPIIPQKQEAFHMSATIFNWWECMEQRSIELSLEYRYMFVTDISNCYGSINPQSIEWALNCRNTKYDNNDNSQLAQNIQTYLRALQHGHNIGIPQGSSLFDFISEIVLGYSDLLLHEALQGIKDNYKKRNKLFTDYEIIRYRDDYRVFCNDKNTLEIISFTLQSVLEKLNFRMNSSKTKISDSIVTDSIKPDKLFYIYNTPIFNKKGVDFDGIQKHLLYILMFSRNYPNSGQLFNMLSDLDKRIKDKIESKEKKVEDVPIDIDNEPKNIFQKLPIYGKKSDKIYENIRVLSAIATQIALENVKVSHYALRIISRLVDSLTDMKEKKDIINKVYQKLCGRPNSDYEQIWLQNITYTQDKLCKKSPYTMPLCKLVMGDQANTLWDNSWIRPSLHKDFPYETIVNQKILQEITPVITFREIRAYDEYKENLKSSDIEINI